METNKDIKDNANKTDKDTKTSTKLMLKDAKDDYIADIKKRVEIFVENLSILFKEYDEESKVSIASIFEEKDDVYINKINDSHLHYVFKIGNKCAAILSLDYLSVKSFIAMLLQLKMFKPDTKEDESLIDKVTNTEKNLLLLIIDMVYSSLKTSFGITEIQNIQVSSLVPYISEKQIAITEISLGNSKGSVALILEPDFVEKSMLVARNADTKSMQKNVENLKVEIQFLTNKKTITLDYLNHLKEGDLIMFDEKINIIANNKMLGIGEMGHLGERIAIMCTNFNRE